VPVVDPTRASLQLYNDSEVSHLDGKNGIGVAYPWGYVVTADGGGRTLAPGAQGTVTVAAKIRKSPGDAAVTTAASFSVLYVVVTDTTSRVTVSPDEADGTRAKAVANALNSAQIVFTPMKANLLGTGDCSPPACEFGSVGNVTVLGPLAQPRLSIDPTKVFRIEGSFKTDTTDYYLSTASNIALNFIRNYDFFHHNTYTCDVELLDGISLQQKACSALVENSWNHDFNLYQASTGFCYGWSREVRKSQTSYQNTLPATVWGYVNNGSGSTLYVDLQLPTPELPDLIETITYTGEVTGPGPGAQAGQCLPSTTSSSDSWVRAWGINSGGVNLDLPPLSNIWRLSDTVLSDDSHRHESLSCGSDCTERYDLDQTTVQNWDIRLIDER